MRNDCICGLYL